MVQHVNDLETRLDSFSLAERRNALKELLDLAKSGKIPLPQEQEIANLHCHTFFSYNSHGFSPTHIAWLGRKLGIRFMGIVDFDVLDGVEEFLDACQLAGVRGSAGMETRCFIPEFSSLVINSPGEPGISYHMGAGFTNTPVDETTTKNLRAIRDRVQQRNQELFRKVKAFLQPLVIDYKKDVVPLTPAGNVTERHMVTVIFEQVLRQYQQPLDFWSEKFSMDKDSLPDIQNETVAFKNLIRKKLMKRGSIGYVPPTKDTFPLIDEVNRVIEHHQALPCVTWLDGTSEGEHAIDDLLALMIDKGAAALNIIPDRNWNIPDPHLKEKKVNNLYQIVDHARQAHLPILVGTEMNSYGQVMVDDFSAPELEPIRKDFIDGAYFIYGHTQMQRLWQMGYQSDWTARHLPTRKQKNDFYHQAGLLIKPTMTAHQAENLISQDNEPKHVINQLKLSGD